MRLRHYIIASLIGILPFAFFGCSIFSQKEVFYPAKDQTGEWKEWHFDEVGPIHAIHDLEAFSAKKAMLLGIGGRIFITNDNGKNWARLESNTSKTLNSSHFINNQFGWAVGNGVIIHSEDAGMSWEKQYSGFNYSLNEVFFLNENYGWAVGNKGNILHTKDGGLNWRPQNNITTNVKTTGLVESFGKRKPNLHDVHFADSTKGWIVTGEGSILKTTNGGLHWKETNKINIGNLKDITFIDKNRGWVVGSEGMVKTINRGSDWIKVYEGNNFNSIQFVNNKYGFVDANYFSNDSGKSWEKYDPRVSKSQLFDFINKDTGWILQRGYGVYYIEKTEETPEEKLNYSKLELRDFDWSDFQVIDKSIWVVDRQKVFKIYENANGYSLNDKLVDLLITLRTIAVHDSEKLWVAGNNGVVYHSKDSGNHWVKQKTPIDKDLMDLFFVDSQKGWAVGESGTIIHTQDGGTNWTVQESGISKNLNTVFFPDEKHGWAVGYNGMVVHTRDSGKTWQNQQLNRNKFSPSLRDVFFINKNKGWIVGRRGTIFQTANAGKTWTDQSPGYGSHYKAVHFVDSNVGWAVTGGNDGHIVHTQSGGKRWFLHHRSRGSEMQDLFFKNQYKGYIITSGSLLTYNDAKAYTWYNQDCNCKRRISNVQFVDSTTGWAFNKNELYYTNNRGLSWEKRSIELPSRYGEKMSTNLYYDFYFINRETGWAVGKHGAIVRTDNGGKRWKLQHGPDNYQSIYDIQFFTAKVGLAVGELGKVYMTNNGGKQWKIRETPTDMALRTMHFPDSKHGWAAGSTGTILHTNDSGKTWIEQGEDLPDRWIDDLFFADKNSGWLVSRSDTIYHTDDGGQSWKRQETPTSKQINAIFFIDEQNGWAVGEKGTILKTTNGGKEWTQQISGIEKDGATKKDLYGIYMLSNDLGWAVGGHSSILHYFTEGNGFGK